MNSYSMENILVPVDLSETALNAMETAVALAKKHSAALYLLHVAEKYPNAGEGGHVFSNTNADVLSAIAGAIRHKHAIVPSIIEAAGNVVEVVIQTSLQITASLIVVGTHGASGYRDGFMGSNAYNIIKYAVCPVLTVPPLKKITAFKKVLFPIRPVSGALNYYHKLAPFLGSATTIDVLGLSYQKAEADTGVLDRLVDEVKPQMKPSVKTNTLWGAHASIPDAVLHHAQQTAPDLLVITSLLDAAAKANYIGPHAQRIMHAARVPALHIKKAGVAAFA